MTRRYFTKFLSIFCSVFFLALSAIATTLISYAPASAAEETDDPAPLDPDSIFLRVLDAEAASEITQLDFRIARSDTGNLVTKRTVVEVGTSNITGYKLYMQSEHQSNGQYTTDLVNTDSSVPDVIPTSTTEPSLYWNYNNPLTNNVSKIPAFENPDKIAQHFEAISSELVPIDINVSVDTTIATGDYRNRLMFTAISNPTTVTYIITFNTNGGVPEVATIEEAAAAGAYTTNIPDVVPTKDEQIFRYWLDRSTGTTYNPGDPITIYSDEEFAGKVDLQAIYNHMSTLTVDPNGGVWGGGSSAQVFVQEESTTKTIESPISGTSYSISYNDNGQGATFTGSPTSVDRPFASWDLSGSGSFDNNVYTFGAEDGSLTAQYDSTSNTFTLPNISKTGHSCKWAEGSASGTQYDGGATNNITTDTTYYAVCDVNQYTLTVNPNGGAWDGSVASQDFIQDYASTKTIEDPTGPSYLISYDDNGQGATFVSSPSSMDRPFVNWSLTGFGGLDNGVYTFGAGPGVLTAQYSTSSRTFTLPEITKPNYTCSWHKGSATGTSYPSEATGVTIDANTTFVAVCSTSRTLTVNPNGGTWNGSTSSQSFVQNYGTTKSIPDPTSEPTYSISYDANGQGASYTGSPTSISRPFSYWELSGGGSLSNKIYTFGAEDGNLTASYDSSSSSFTLPSISKTGYSCKWAEGSPSGTQYAGGTSRTITGNTTYYAVCSINSYTLTVSPNGGIWSGSTSSQSFSQNYGTTKTISNPTSGPSYAISYNANGQGASYTGSPTSVSRSFSSWSLSGYGSFVNGTYTFGAGSGTLIAQYSSTSKSFTLPTITKSGYTCKWAKGSSSGTQYSGGSSTTISSSTTFYAVCTANRSSLTINPNGGTYGGSTSSTTVYGYEGDTYKLSTPTGPTYDMIYRDLYNSYQVDSKRASNARAFSSWSKSGGGSLSGSTYTFGAGTTATVTASYATSTTHSIYTIHSAYVCSKTFYWKESTSGTKYQSGTITVYGTTYFYEVCE